MLCRFCVVAGTPTARLCCGDRSFKALKLLALKTLESLYLVTVEPYNRILYYLNIVFLHNNNIVVFIHFNSQLACEQIDLLNNATAVSSLDDSTHLWCVLEKILIAVLLVFQTAHKSSASA